MTISTLTPQTGPVLTGPVWRQPINILWILATLLLVAKIVFSLNIVWQIFNFAFQVDESESMIVAEVGLFDKGVGIYAQPDPHLFISAPYTPFYYLLNWPFIHLLGTSFKPGRLISLAAVIGVGWLIYAFVRRYQAERGISRGRWPAALASLVWFALGLVAFWGIAVKPDMTALLLDLAGLYLIFKRPQGRTLYLAAGLFALAALTKQTAFAGIVAAGLWLLLSGPEGWRIRFWRTLRFSLVYLGIALIPMLVLNWLTAGGFWYHIVTVHELPWSAQNYLKFLAGFLQSYQLLALAGLVFLVFWLSETVRGGWSGLRNNPGTLVVLYVGTAGAVSLSTGTYGGNHNHLLELAAALCIAFGIVLSRLVEMQANRWGRWALAATLALVCWQGVGFFMGEARITPDDVPLGPGSAVLSLARAEFYNSDWLGLEYRAPQPVQKERLAQIAAFMNNDSSRLIYSDNVSLMLATTKPLFTTDPFTQTHATHYGRWDQSVLLGMVQKQEFGMIVLRQAIEQRVSQGNQAGDIYFSPELASAVSQNYRLACHDAAYIYVPKSRTDFKGC